MSQVMVVVGMGTGVSAAVGRRFGREGFRVIGLARRAGPLQAEVAALRVLGVEADGQVADAGDASGLTAALAQLSDTHGVPDVLVYNAGVMRHQPLSTLSADELMADLQVSVGSALAAAQALLPGMRARGSGSLLFTGGGFALEPMPAMASLGAGKAALRNLVYSLHADLQEVGLHAATVTICGVVKAGTRFDPERIADSFWQLHRQPPNAFEREVLIR